MIGLLERPATKHEVPKPTFTPATAAKLNLAAWENPATGAVVEVSAALMHATPAAPRFVLTKSGWGFGTVPTSAALIAEVRRLAAANPTYVYPTYTAPEYRPQAYYVADRRTGRVACLIGQALTNLGVNPDVLIAMEGCTITAVGRALGINATRAETLWLRQVQKIQDAPHPWSLAIADADTMIKHAVVGG